MENLPISVLIKALAAGVYFNRKGLVHDCVFPLVKVAGCRFSFPDWINEANGWMPTDDSVTCHGDANEIKPSKVKLITESLADHALIINLTNCCDVDCNGNPLADFEKRYAQELINTLLINREIEAKNLVVNAPWSNSVADPNSESSEGKRYTITPTNFADQNYDLAKFIDGIQVKNPTTGKRNFAVIPQDLLMQLLRRKQFIGFGCDVDAKTSVDQLAKQLGVDKICVPDQDQNTGTPEELTLSGIWPSDTILFGVNKYIGQTEDEKRTFGFSANTQTDRNAEGGEPTWLVNKWLDKRKGKGEGNQMLKIGHDETPIVADIKAGTLIKVTT